MQKFSFPFKQHPKASIRAVLWKLHFKCNVLQLQVP